jgi:hypothetical protein
MTFTPVDSDLSPDEFFDPEADDEADPDSDTAEDTHDKVGEVPLGGSEPAKETEAEKEAARLESLDKLQRGPERTPEDSQTWMPKERDTVKLSWKRGTTGAAVRRSRKANSLFAVIVLKEEKVRASYD